MKTILALTDFSHKSIHAAEYGLRLAEDLHTDLFLFNTFTEQYDEPALFAIKKDDKKQAEAHLAEVAARLKKQSEINAFLLHRPEISYSCEEGEPSDLGESIALIADQRETSLIVMGAKGDECLSNFIPGTETYSVIQNAKCPVLFVPENTPFNKIRKMALITEEGDFNEHHLSSLLNSFQQQFNTEILLTNISPVMHVVGSTNSYDNQLLGLRGQVLKVDEYDLADQLQEVSGKAPIDVLAVMFHKEHLFERIFHSSTSKLLMYNVNLPLLVFPGN